MPVWLEVTAQFGRHQLEQAVAVAVHPVDIRKKRVEVRVERAVNGVLAVAAAVVPVAVAVAAVQVVQERMA